MSHHHTMAPSGQGTVVLDIGAEVGALVIDVPPQCHGMEIEVSPAGAHRPPRTHAAVRARHVAGGIRYCAVIGGLPAGPYVVWRDADTPVGRVTVAGGTVCEFRWPDTAG